MVGLLQQDWRVRQQAVEALGTLAAAIQASQRTGYICSWGRPCLMLVHALPVFAQECTVASPRFDLAAPDAAQTLPQAGCEHGLTAAQVHKPSQEGAWFMERTACTEVLMLAKPGIATALREARHDRIVHVQQAAAKVSLLAFILVTQTINSGQVIR